MPQPLHFPHLHHRLLPTATCRVGDRLVFERGGLRADCARDRRGWRVPRRLAAVRDIDRRGAWDDRMIAALYDPPETFVIGAVVAHVLTYAAFRRQVTRMLLRGGGHPVGDGDPID